MTAPPTPQSPAGAADLFHGWTVASLGLIALAAIVVIAGILYGMHLARQRHRAADAAEERAEEAGHDLPPTPEPPAVEDAGGLPAPAPHPEPDTEPLSAPPAPEPAAKPEPIVTPEPEPTLDRQPESDPELQPEPESAPAAVPAPASPDPIAEPDVAGALSLTTIKGLGPKVAAMLAERGITRVDQIAALSDDAATALDAELGTFTGRMARDRWIDQAKLLSTGDTAAYEAEFGKLG